jgi:sugar/nucleoside kinase (ribokinase family)
MSRLGVVGLVSLDRVDGGIPRLGGAPWYAARALRLLDQPSIIVTKLAAEDASRGLHALGVPVAWRPASGTITFRIENAADGRALELEEAGEAWSVADVDEWVRDALAGCDWVHAGALTGNDFPADVLAALRRGRRLSFDGQGLARSSDLGPVALGSGFDREVLRHIDVLKLSQEEAEAIGVELDERGLRSLGVPEIVVTLGSKGSVVYADGLAERIPTRPLDVLDPTGAGDQLTAAYVSYRSRGHAPVAAARLATEVVNTLLREQRASHERRAVLSV